MKYVMLLVLALLSTACTRDIPVQLGDRKVVIHYVNQGQGKTYVHLHQNETTALKAAQTLIDTEGGKLITLDHSGKRNIVFYLKSKRYEFDPNRIFTEEGIKKTLMTFGEYSCEAHKEVRKLAHKIKLILPRGKIIAVHNNHTFSLKDYLPGHSLAADAQALHFYDKAQYRNFYVVTKYKDYSRLNAQHFNSVWQANDAINDGSLSIYLASRQYINVEAGYDQLTSQINMLKHA